MTFRRKTLGAAAALTLLAAPIAYAQTGDQPALPSQPMPMGQGGMMGGMMGQGEHGEMSGMMARMNDMMDACSQMMQAQAPNGAPAAPQDNEG